MRVLHLPQNIASQMSVTVLALRDIGIESRGLVVGNTAIQDPTGLETMVGVLPRRRHPVRGTLQLRVLKRAILDAIRWADVVHWHYSWTLPQAYDVQYAARMGKAGIVEFWGSDIRIPRVAAADNPYWTKLYADFPQLIENGAEGRSRERQRRFAECGHACLVPTAELLAYVDPELFPAPYRTRQRVLLDHYQASYPESDRSRPLLVHMPSDKAKKGTDSVLRAVEVLRHTHDFDFRLLNGVTRWQALRVLQSCDIFLDQFVGGDYGLASLEAMALGKPTVCYVKPSLLLEHPPELPIVVADQDNLTDVLRGLLEDGHRRHEIGRLSRAYVENYHDSRDLAFQLVGIYEEMLTKAKTRRAR